MKSVVGTLVGDIKRESFARVKYGLLFSELAKIVQLGTVYDASLKGPLRWLNLAQTLHPNIATWRERYYKNLSAFHLRSWQVGRKLRKWSGKASSSLQLGVLYNACLYQTNPVLRNVIYTDYTQALSIRAPAAWRSPFSTQQRQAWLAVEQQAYQQAAHICTRSMQVKLSVIEDYEIDPAKVTVVGGGVNFDRLPVVPDRASRQGPKVLFIGKEFARKGGDLALLAFEQARLVVPDLQMTMVTSGPIPPELSLDGVEVFQPSWDRAWIASLFEQADLFMLPSRLETWGDVLLEAMAYGLPCVGVEGQAMEEIITHRRNGWLAEPEDVTTLAAGLIELAGDREFRHQCSKEARATVERSFTWQVVANHLAEYL